MVARAKGHLRSYDNLDNTLYSLMVRSTDDHAAIYIYWVEALLLPALVPIFILNTLLAYKRAIVGDSL